MTQIPCLTSTHKELFSRCVDLREHGSDVIFHSRSFDELVRVVGSDKQINLARLAFFPDYAPLQFNGSAERIDTNVKCATPIHSFIHSCDSMTKEKPPFIFENLKENIENLN